MKPTADVQAREARPGNLASRVRWGPRLARLAAAVGAGLFLTAAFPPLQWSLAAWVALAPLLVIADQEGWPAWRLGYVFGLAHYTSCFAWLAPVFILAPLGVALVCAVFPACWLTLAVSLRRNLAAAPEIDLHPRHNPRAPTVEHFTPARQCFYVLALAALWCGLEWVRSWILTGFPWNQLGISQWRNAALLPLSRYTGVYGISFLIACVNGAVALSVERWRRRADGGRRGFPAALAVSAALAAVCVWLPRGRYRMPAACRLLRVVAVQGNMPQNREFSDEQLTQALNVYLGLTREAVRETRPDLVVWPETAVPAPLTVERRCSDALAALFADIHTPLLAGTIDYRAPPGAQDWSEARSFNSALLFDRRGVVVDRYDKIHIVPFGEFVPFEEHLPWLVEWIGMGRSLTRGRAYRVMPFPPPSGQLDAWAHIGVNICYEDIFPDISRTFIRHGADVLLTLTNDAWFAQSAGGTQHLAHAVFRAVEMSRPLLRSGNNSETALILPDGRVTGLLTAPRTAARFYRGWRLYRIPIRRRPPLTFYARYGDLFALLCAAASMLVAGWCVYRFVDRKRRLLALVCPRPGA